MDQFRFARLVQERGIELIPVPFELRPTMPDEGLSASEHHLGHSRHVEERVIELARAEGRTMVIPDVVPKTHLAMVLGEAARDISAEKHWDVHIAVFDAHYVDGRDIGRKDVLLDIAEAHGIGRDVLTDAWDRGLYEERLHQFYHLALSLGVMTTPAALICNELLIGTRPYRILADTVDRCLVRAETLDDETGSSPAS